MTTNMGQMHGKNNFSCLIVYKCCNYCFLPWCCSPSHLVVESMSFAYIFISPHNTALIDPDSCPCASKSTCFFMLVQIPPFRASNTCELSILSSSLPSELSLLKTIEYPRLHKTHFCYHFTLSAATCKTMLQRKDKPYEKCVVFANIDKSFLCHKYIGVHNCYGHVP